MPQDIYSKLRASTTQAAIYIILLLFQNITLIADAIEFVQRPTDFRINELFFAYAED